MHQGMAECTEMAWRVSWQRPKSADYLWMAVSEPMAPLQACLMDMEWGAAALDDWVREPKRHLASQSAQPGIFLGNISSGSCALNGSSEELGASRSLSIASP